MMPCIITCVLVLFQIYFREIGYVWMAYYIVSRGCYEFEILFFILIDRVADYKI